MKRLGFISICVVLTACAPVFGPDSNYAGMGSSNQILSAVGYASISDQTGSTLDEKRFRAMRASKFDAYRELAEQLYGIQIKGSISLDEQKLKQEATFGDVDGLIRGAEVVRSYPVGDNYVTELKLDTQRMRALEKTSGGSSSGGGGAVIVPSDGNTVYY